MDNSTLEAKLAPTTEVIAQFKHKQPVAEPAVSGTWDLNDDGNSSCFAAQYADVLRYDCTRNIWLIWNKHRWTVDAAGYVFELATKLHKARWHRAWDIGDPKLAKKTAEWLIRSNDQKRIKACVEGASHKPELVRSGDSWDRMRLLLGVQNGVLDLQKGILRDGQQDDYLTKALPIDYDPKAKCPRWEQFLQEVFQGDNELINFVWRAVGYTLSAEVSEECLFFLYGIGRNGKSVFLNTLKRIFGDYSWSLPFESLTRKQGDAIPTDLTDIDGRRLIICAESRKDRGFDEQRVKNVVSRDDITARRMRKDFYTFSPTHKVWLMANHRPEVEDATEGFWRRLRLIPFKAQFDGNRRDRQLERTLFEERAGILNWALRGCLEWQKVGLATPPVVERATKQYREHANGYQPFIDARLLFYPTGCTASAELQTEYADWRKLNEDAPGYSDKLTALLREHGCESDMISKDGKRMRVWYGVATIGAVKRDFPGMYETLAGDLRILEDALSYYTDPTAD